MAKIATITNPLTGQPVQVDQLEHTAQQIDDAIALALPGGAIDISLANNDPRKWGLGTSWVSAPSRDANQISKTGFFVACVNTPTGNWWGILHIQYDDTSATQLGWCQNNSALYGAEVKRELRNGVWGPWEWVNPPMTLGVEYRTTERRNGSPVFCKYANLGKLTNGSFGEIPVDSLDVVVAYEAMFVNRPLPVINNSSLTDAGSQYVNVIAHSGTIIRVYYYGGANVSGNGDLYVLVKYTKNA